MNNSNVLFSIIIPLYNKGPYIAKTLSSVLSQTYSNFEVLVIDDGSTDDGKDVVKAFPDNRVKYFWKVNGGVSSARNYGIMKSKGEWIYFLDADDMMLPDTLKLFYDVINSFDGRLDVITGSYKAVTKGKNRMFETKENGVVSNNYKWYFLNKFYMGPGRAVVRREIMQANLYNEDLYRYEDMEQVLRMLKGLKIYVIRDIVFEYLCDNSTLSRTISNKDRDFTFHMDFKGKSFWEKCKMGELLMLAFSTYRENKIELLLQYKWNVLYSLIAKVKILFNKTSVRYKRQ